MLIDLCWALVFWQAQLVYALRDAVERQDSKGLLTSTHD